MVTVGRRIAEWVAAISYDSLPQQTVHEAKRRVLDSIGCCLGAYRSLPAGISRSVAESAADLHGLLCGERALVVGLNTRHSPMGRWSVTWISTTRT